MNLQNVFNQVFILFIILIIGYAAKKLHAVDEGFDKGLTNFIINVSLPMLIISSMKMEVSQEILVNIGKLMVVFVAVYGISIAVAFLIPRLFKITGSKKGVYEFTLIFSNVGFMGIPVINAIYGSKGLFYSVILNLPFNILMWTLGIMIISSGKEEKISFKKMLNPGVISVLIGLIFYLFSIRLPGPIATSVDTIGSVTTPLSMILIGITLAKENVGSIFKDPMIYLISIIRLIIIPVLCLLILKPFVSDSLILGVPVASVAMPAAANAVIFAGKYGGDTYAASSSVFISTLLSIATIPLIVYIMNII